MLADDQIYLGTSNRPQYLPLRYAERLGPVARATGKTIGPLMLGSLRRGR